MAEPVDFVVKKLPYDLGCPEQLGFVSATGPMFSDNAMQLFCSRLRTTFSRPFGPFAPLSRPAPCFQAHLPLRRQQLVAHHPQVR